MGVILSKAAYTHKTVKSSGQLVTMNQSKLRHTRGEDHGTNEYGDLYTSIPPGQFIGLIA